MSDFLSEMEKPWSIGNGINLQTDEFEGPYFEVIVYGGMNLNGHHLEIMNTKITVVGDTINSYGGVTKRFFAISDLIVEGETLTITEPQELYEMKMYPNPATDFVTFKGNYIEKMFVYDLNMKLVERIKVRNTQYKLDLRNYSRGIYIIQIGLQDNRGTFKKLIVN